MAAAIVYLVLVAVIAFVLKAGNRSIPDEWPLERRKPLSNPEQVLYYRLVSALPDYVVLA